MVAVRRRPTWTNHKTLSEKLKSKQKQDPIEFPSAALPCEDKEKGSSMIPFNSPKIVRPLLTYDSGFLPSAVHLQTHE